MGVIKKKTAVRGTEGGVKYICDVCSADITSTVRIRCAHELCKDYDLCVPCFSQGATSRDHDPATHPFYVIEQHSIPIFADDWGADEENLLLEGAETYGLGSWADIADHIGGFREKDEVRDHYIETYINSSKFPLPERASPADRSLTDEWPREKFLRRKKRRIEEHKEQRANATPPKPDAVSKASVPACHEVAGYMPGRMEFETEHYNEAEEAVQHMQFDPGEGELPDANGKMDEEVNLKQTVMGIYNDRLTARVERKRIIFEHEMLEYKRNTNSEKKLSADEKQIYNKAKPFARLMKHEDFQAFSQDLLYEHNVREAINQLQEWRRMQVGDFKSGTVYEREKGGRLQRLASMGGYDRFATTGRSSKPLPAVDTPQAVLALTSTELPSRSANNSHAPANSTPSQATAGVSEKKGLTNGDINTNGTSTPIAHRPKFSFVAPSNITRLNLDPKEFPDMHLLTSDEQEICSALRLAPKSYIMMKESVLRRAQKHGGLLKKKDCREICRIDSSKAAKLFDYWSFSGWIGKA